MFLPIAVIFWNWVCWVIDVEFDCSLEKVVERFSEFWGMVYHVYKNAMGQFVNHDEYECVVVVVVSVFVSQTEVYFMFV